MEKIETLLLLNARPPTRAASMASLLDEDHEEQHAPFNGGGIPTTTTPTGLRPQNRNDLRSTTPASTSAPGFGNPGMPGRWSAKPPPPFKGKDGENVLSWLLKIENAMNHSWVPEESKVVFCSALLSEHADNWYYMYHSKHPAATYAEFRAAFIERFERTEEREDILRDQLRSIRFGGIHKMGDYISRFQKVENQLFNMAYKDRLDHFKSPFPTELRLHLQRLKFKEMDGAYQAAREWAIQGVLEQRKSMKPGGSKHSNPPSGKSTLFRPKLGQEKKEKEKNDSEDELDLMDAKQLAGITCYNCRKKGHLSRDCPKPRKPKFDKKKNFKQHAKALYLTQETSGSGEGSDSDNSGTNGDSDDDSDDQLNAIDLYELAEDGDEVNTSSKSEKLPIFNAEVNDEHAAKVILDTGATTVYISEEYVHQIGAEITDIAPRSIRVANREVVQTSGLTKIRMKLGNLSPELITAYVFPLKKIDIILGLPWLKKHNPHVDFRTMSYEFTRNGRRYQLYPAEAPRASKLRVVDAKEFKEFMGDSELYVIHHSDNDDSSEIELLKEKPSGLGKKKRKRFEKTKKWMSEILVWIKGKCPKLLCQIGKPAKLPPFKIDTGDKEPINLRPRPYSPVDLGKIRTFLDENIANHARLCRLSRAEPDHGEGRTSATAHRRKFRPPRPRGMVHIVRS